MEVSNVLSFFIHELAFELNLDEGGILLVLSSKVGPKVGMEKVRFKCDHLNPFGSFKYRSAAANPLPSEPS